MYRLIWTDSVSTHRYTPRANFQYTNRGIAAPPHRHDTVRASVRSARADTEESFVVAVDVVVVVVVVRRRGLPPFLVLTTQVVIPDGTR